MNTAGITLSCNPPIELSWTSCVDCHRHRVEADPDSDTWSSSDNIKVVCGLANRNVVSCQRSQRRKESAVPDWCPLIQKMILDRLDALTEENEKLKKLINKETQNG